jgi:hypothetical protein
MFALQYVGFYLHCRKVGGGGGLINDWMCDLKTVLWSDRIRIRLTYTDPDPRGDKTLI